MVRERDWVSGWTARKLRQAPDARPQGIQARDPATDRRKMHSRPDWQARQRLLSAESLGLTLEEYDALSRNGPDTQADAPAPDAAWDDDASWGQ